jgi:hypothetical protein
MAADTLRSTRASAIAGIALMAADTRSTRASAVAAFAAAVVASAFTAAKKSHSTRASEVAALAISAAHSWSIRAERNKAFFVTVAMALVMAEFDRFRVIAVTRKRNSTPRIKQSVNMNCYNSLCHSITSSISEPLPLFFLCHSPHVVYS